YHRAEIGPDHQLATADHDVVHWNIRQVAADIGPRRATVDGLEQVADAGARTFSPSARETVEAKVRGVAARIRRVDRNRGDVAVRQIRRDGELMKGAARVRRDAARKPVVVAGTTPRRIDDAVLRGDRGGRMSNAVVEDRLPLAA